MRALAPGAASVADAVAGIVADVRARGDAALSEYVERFDGVERPAARGAPTSWPARARRPRSRGPRRPGGRDRQRARGRRSPGATTSARCCCPQGQVVRLREVPVRRAAIYVPGGRAPYPSTVVMGVVTARAAGVEEVVVCAPGRAPGHPRRLRAVRGRRGLPHGRRPRGRRAGLRHRERAARRRHRRPRQPLRPGGQAAGQRRRRHRRLRRALRRARAGRRGRRPRARGDRPRRPGRARRGHHRLRGERRPGAARRDRPSTPGAAAGGAGGRPRPRGGAGLRRGLRARAPRAHRRRGRGAGAARAQRRLRLRRAPRAPPPSATTSPARTTRCPPAGPRASPRG